jgi:DNA-binding LacI/PurR family transcriptional regulator
MASGSVDDDAWRDPEVVAASLPTPTPDAVVCYDDKLALALLDGLRSRGVRVPDDVSVIGFDGIPFAALSNPRLTTVATPTLEMGRVAARSLVAAIGTGSLPRGLVLPTELVVRESAHTARASLPARARMRGRPATLPSGAAAR